METRIIFLIIVLLSLFFIFTESGRNYLSKYVGLQIKDKNFKDIEDSKQTNKMYDAKDFTEKELYGGSVS